MLAIVVDDDPVLRGLAGRILRRAGMGCLGFASADDAVPALAELGGEVSVLVTDVQMPGSLDGLGLARHVGEVHAGLPVIVMSGAPEALAIAASLPSVVAVLEKPFMPADLARLAIEAARGAGRGVVSPALFTSATSAPMPLAAVSPWRLLCVKSGWQVRRQWRPRRRMRNGTTPERYVNHSLAPGPAARGLTSVAIAQPEWGVERASPALHR